MRIIAGVYKGRVLRAPKGGLTRPTTDRIREALMSTVASALGGFEGEAVLDAFAGSGALGLEALSRGAYGATFYEKDAGAFSALRANIEGLGVPRPRYVLRHADILKSPPRAAEAPYGPYGLVFLDPPYALGAADSAALLARIAAAGLLAPEALVSYEHAKSMDSAVKDAFDSLQWELVSHKHYGDTAITFLRRKP